MPIHRTNMITTKNRKLLLVTNPEDDVNRVDFHTWSDSPKFLWRHTGAADNFNIKTKDIDFGNISRRKKIYRVYVTFKAGGYMSGVLLKYATNGSDRFSGTFSSTTGYDSSRGFDSWLGSQASSSDDWITVALSPTTTLSTNNIYSMQLKFEYADAGRHKKKILLANSSNGDPSGTDTNIFRLDIDTTDANHNTDDWYNGMPIFFYAGPGAHGQEYRVIDYDEEVSGVDNDHKVTIDNVQDGVLTAETPVNTLENSIHDEQTYYDVGSIPEQFAINDIAIIYREKPVK